MSGVESRLDQWVATWRWGGCIGMADGSYRHAPIVDGRCTYCAARVPSTSEGEGA